MPSSPPIPLLDELVTDQQLAEMTGWSRSTLWSLRRKGLPHFRVGGKILYRPREIEKFILRCRKK